MSIEVQNISRRFGPFVALDQVSLGVRTGELLAVLGPSGSGKTTLLRVIAGLEQPDSGRVLFFDQDTTDQHVRDRGVGFVFQHYALFKHMTVAENVGFGLTVRPRGSRPTRKAIAERVHELLALVQLESSADRRPSQLSGGQRQRVALARALAVEPRVLLLDEPFGALDAKVRADLRRWLRRLHDQVHVTTVFVTHDQEEAMEVADRVVIMREGTVEQIGTPNEVYEHPGTPFVYDFLGNVNVFQGRVRAGHVHLEVARPAPSPKSNGRNHNRLNGHAPAAPDDDGLLFVRPHMLDLDRRPPAHSPDTAAIRAQVRRINAAGPIVRLLLMTDSGVEISADLSRERFDLLRPAPEEHLYVRARSARAFARAEIDTSLGEGI